MIVRKTPARPQPEPRPSVRDVERRIRDQDASDYQEDSFVVRDEEESEAESATESEADAEESSDASASEASSSEAEEEQVLGKLNLLLALVRFQAAKTNS